MAAPDRPVARKRPVYLDLFAIRLPFPAFVSILHRVSGTLLFLVAIPLLLLTVRDALGSPDAWANVRHWFDSPWVKLVTLALAWAFLHHLFAGVRHLLMDLHIGMELRSARQSAVIVFVLALLLTLILAVRLW
jgi:succinate dehydrogenase / fumarate reductase, cytochrome b subunit